MFKSKFKYTVNPEKGVVAVSPTVGTLLKWIIAPLLSLVFSLKMLDVAFALTEEKTLSKEMDDYIATPEEETT